MWILGQCCVDVGMILCGFGTMLCGCLGNVVWMLVQCCVDVGAVLCEYWEDVQWQLG